MDQSHAYDSVVDMSYTADFDIFTLKTSDDAIDDIAVTPLGEGGDDFIAFDNADPGRLVGAMFHGNNEIAMAVMMKLFDGDFARVVEAMREGARVYEQETTRTEITVPYTNSRRLARIALHARSETASAAIKTLAEKVA